MTICARFVRNEKYAEVGTDLRQKLFDLMVEVGETPPHIEAAPEVNGE